MVCGICGEDGHNRARCPTTFSKPPCDSHYVKLLRNGIEEIYNTLGFGHTESVYHNAMKILLHDLGLSFETECCLPIKFRNRQVGVVRADLIVESKLVIELKSLNINNNAIQDSIDQCRLYMRETSIVDGLVVIFPRRCDIDLLILPVL
jgi:GxxExxY protein